jgi:hypothetical protein
MGWVLCWAARLGFRFLPMQISRLSLLSVAISASLAGNALAQNDDCSGAIFVTQGLNGPFTNVGSSTSVPAWPCGAGDNDVWFVYIAPGAGSLTADTCTGTNYDSTIEIFDGAAGCGSLVSLGCNDDSCALQSSLTVPSVTTGGTYYIRVGGFGGATGTFSLNINGPSGTGTVATNTTIGTGCIRKFASFYENFVSAAGFDLNNTAMTLLPTSPGYIGLGIGTYVPPPATATTLTLLDDSETTQALTTPFPYDGGVASSLTVCSNGYVSVATGNGTGYVPSVPTMLAASQTGWWNWHDYNPTIPGSGAVKFHESGSIAYITWDGVWDYGGSSSANANTFQFQFDSGVGSVALAWQTMSSLGGTTATGFLVGYSPGGASADPGNTDLSAALPLSFTVFGVDVLPLSVVAVSRPVIGTSWNLSTGNIPATAIIGVDVFGVTDPNLNDLAVIGAPGCGLRASLDVLNAWLPAGSTHGYGLALPNSPSLINVHVYTTSAAFLVPPPNAFGAITGNGIDGRIGNL